MAFFVLISRYDYNANFIELKTYYQHNFLNRSAFCHKSL